MRIRTLLILGGSLAVVSLAGIDVAVACSPTRLAVQAGAIRPTGDPVVHPSINILVGSHGLGPSGGKSPDVRLLPCPEECTSTDAVSLEASRQIDRGIFSGVSLYSLPTDLADGAYLVEAEGEEGEIETAALTVDSTVAPPQSLASDVAVEWDHVRHTGEYGDDCEGTILSIVRFRLQPGDSDVADYYVVEISGSDGAETVAVVPGLNTNDGAELQRIVTTDFVVECIEITPYDLYGNEAEPVRSCEPAACSETTELDGDYFDDLSACMVQGTGSNGAESNGSNGETDPTPSEDGQDVRGTDEGCCRTTSGKNPLAPVLFLALLVAAIGIRRNPARLT